MADAIESGQDIELTGITGERYRGKIYADKSSTSSLTEELSLFFPTAHKGSMIGTMR